MLWVLLFTIIFSSSNEVFFLPKASKYLQQIVSDEHIEAYKEIAVKVEADRKAFIKRKKQFKKDLQELNASEFAQRSEYNILVQAYFLDVHEFGLLEIYYRDSVLKLITDENVRKVYELLQEDLEKQLNKLDKDEDKLNVRWDKYVQDIVEVVDEPYKSETKAYMKTFSDSLKADMDIFVNCFLPHNEKILKRSTSQEEMLKFLFTSEEARKRILKRFIDLRFFLQERSQKNQWPRVAKTINSIV